MTFSFPSSFIHLYSFPTFQMKLPSLQWLGERLQGADMHGNGYSGDTAAFLRLKHENCNKHRSTFIYQHHFFGSVNQHIIKQSISRCDLQTYRANWLYVSMNSKQGHNSKLPTSENGSHDAALRGACSARHGMNGEDPADLEQQLLRPNIAQGDPAVTDDFWCSSWTLKGLETHHLAK